MAETSIKPCDCKHEYQDQQYGKGRRVHNRAAKTNSTVPDWVCTVCGKRKGS